MDQAPVTMRSLFGLLENFDAASAEDAEMLDELVGTLGESARKELGHRLLRPSTSHELKRLIYTAPLRLPAPDWTPLLLRGLLHEHVPDLFEDGCRVLVKLGGMEEADALRQLAHQKADPELSAIVTPKLAFVEDKQPFQYHYKDLLQAGRHPRLAQQAVRHLSGKTPMEHLPELAEAVAQGDEMVGCMALQVIATLRDPMAAGYLVDRYREISAALEEDRRTKEALDHLRGLEQGPLQDALTTRLEALEGEEARTQALARIRKGLEEGTGAKARDLEILAEVAQGTYEKMLVQTLEAAVAGRQTRLAALPGEVLGGIRKRTPRLRALLGELAQGLGTQTDFGLLETEDLLVLLEPAFIAGLGSDGLSWAFASHLEATSPRLELILSAIDPQRRETCLRVLGEREEAALLPFFLKAMGDPIVDLAQQAGRYLGRLPGAFDTAKRLLEAGGLEGVLTAFRIFALNGMSEAGAPILAFLETCEREDLSLEGFRTLGALRHRPAIPYLLSLLRGGISIRTLQAAGEALAAMEDPEAAHGLARKVLDLRQGPLFLLGLDALAAQHPGPELPLPSEMLPVAEALFEKAFQEGTRYRLEAVTRLTALWCPDGAFCERMRGRLAEFQAEQRRRPTWDREEAQMVTTTLRELERRPESFAAQARKDMALREALETSEPSWEALEELAREARDPVARKELGDWIARRMNLPGPTAEELERLCRLSHHAHDPDLEQPLWELLHRAGSASDLHEAAQQALSRLGLPQSRLRHAPPMRELLLLEPSAFFRNRMLSVLQDGPWQLRVAADRGEAERHMQEAPPDLLVSELADEAGSLHHWFLRHWERRAFRKVFLSTSDRQATAHRRAPWCAGILLKPYPPEKLLGRLVIEGEGGGGSSEIRRP